MKINRLAQLLEDFLSISIRQAQTKPGSMTHTVNKGALEKIEKELDLELDKLVNNTDISAYEHG